MSPRANGGVRGLPGGDIVRNRADWALLAFLALVAASVVMAIIVLRVAS